MMKKMIGILMIMVLVLTGTAFAETVVMPVTLEQPVLTASDSCVLVEIVEADSNLSYVLLGTGDGLDVFDAFSVDMNDYEEGYDRVWKFLSAMTPNATINGAGDLHFNAMNDSVPGTTCTEVIINGEAVARLSGLEVYAILSGEASDMMPVVNELCSVVLWTNTGSIAHPASGAEIASLCVNCGKIDTGSDDHDTLISRYCEDEHTVCMGDPIHYCEGCEQEYPCSKSGSHTKCAVCGELWCYKEEGDHKELECGHRGCEVFGHEIDHAQCLSCGAYLCDGKDHEHPAVDDGEAEIPETETPETGDVEIGE